MGFISPFDMWHFLYFYPPSRRQWYNRPWRNSGRLFLDPDGRDNRTFVASTSPMIINRAGRPTQVMRNRTIYGGDQWWTTTEGWERNLQGFSQ